MDDERKVEERSVPKKQHGLWLKHVSRVHAVMMDFTAYDTMKHWKLAFESQEQIPWLPPPQLQEKNKRNWP